MNFDYITYYLNPDSFHNYYNLINQLNDNLLNEISNIGGSYVDDFIYFINSNNIERSYDKRIYSLEFLMIGVFYDEYIKYAINFNNSSLPIYKFFNKCRNFIFKDKIDIIRGKLNTILISKSSPAKKVYQLEDFNLLIKWLTACGDFKEEVFSLNLWYDYLSQKDFDYVDNFFKSCLNLSTYLMFLGDNYLHKYTQNLENYLDNYKILHLNKEDIIYCGKTPLQYYFNMICSEIMNNIFKDDFINTKEKIVFLPSCMTQTLSKCQSKSTDIGYKCVHCNNTCNVNTITNLGLKHSFKVYIIPHETSLFKLHNENNSDIGIIGISCIPNLISGGFKALRLGFIPQCVPLNYSGCSNHWLEEPLMTSINLQRLLDIVTQ